jgi:hypothetical protein
VGLTVAVGMVTSGSSMPLDRVAAGAGAVDVGRARSALDLFDQVRAMTWRLLHPRGVSDPLPEPDRNAAAP